MQLIHLPRNPRNLLREIDLIAQDIARLRRRPQRIKRAVHDTARALLVIEYTQHTRAGGDDENRQRV